MSGDALPSISIARSLARRAARVGRLAPLVIAVALAGCSSCESGGPVPFGLDAGGPGEQPRGDRGGSVLPEDRASVATTPSISLRELPEGTTRVDVEGAAIELGGAPILAVVAWDSDGDRDRDALVIAPGAAGGGPRVLAALREGASFAVPVELVSAPPLAAGCSIARSGARALDAAILAIELEAACPEDELGASRVLHAFAIASGPRPRVLERFVLRARAGDGGAPIDALRLRSEDRDEDGHADLIVDLALAVDGEAAADVSLALLDRPGGLARDAAEPEARIAALAQEARGALRRRPERARGTARRAIALYEALCRESGRSRLELGGAGGLPCGRSAATGRALAVLAQAAARTGQPLEAALALARLETAHVSVRDADRDAARAAIDGIAATPGEVHEGPPAAAPAERGPRLSALAFLDEQHLLLRGDRARVIDLGTGAELAPPEHASTALALVDPSGTHRLAAIERRCAGTVLVIAASDALGDLTGARTIAPVAPRRPPPGAPCPDLTPALRADDDGWRALGWAPQGVLAARGVELRVVPLDLGGRPAGDAVPIEPGAAIPAPIAPGHATADARAYATFAPGGIVLVELAPGRRTTLIRPAEHAAFEGAPIDVAISPSARRLAWIAEGHVRWLELGAAGSTSDVGASAGGATPRR